MAKLVKFYIFILLVALGVSQRCAAQDVPLVSSADSATADSPPYIPVVQTPAPLREISWKRLVPNMLQDQKDIWLFPVSVARGHHLKPTLAVVGITAGLVALDEHNMKFIRSTQAFSGFNKAFDGPHTSLAMEAFPAAFFALGLLRRDTYAQHTVMLAGEAVLGSEILTSVMKDIDRRYRPVSVPPNGDLSATWFEETHGSYLGGVGSFPSGHTIAAFSIATVFAERYPKPRWHAFLAYSLAGLVGFSRVPLQSHFPSDVFAGAALAYAITHYIVLRPRSTSVAQDTP